MPTAYPDPVGPLPKAGLGSKSEEIRTGSPAGFQFRRLPFRSDKGSRVTHSGPVDGPPGKIKVHHVQGQLHGQTIHVPGRPSYGHGEASLAGPSSHETNPVAGTRSPRESHPGSPVAPPSPGVVAERAKCVRGATFTPSSTCSSTVYRRLKRRLGRTLRGLHCKRRLVQTGKPPSHKFFRTKGSSPGPEEFRASVQRSHCSCPDRQHHSGILHQQARGYEVRLSLCPPLETSLLVPPQGNCAESKAHSGPLERDSRQAFQGQPGDSNRVVPFSAGFQSVVLQMAPTTSRFVCDPVQLQTSSVCIAGSGPDSLGGGRPESPVAGSGRVCLPTSVPDRSGGVEDGRSRMSVNDPDCPRLAKHALVLGPHDPVSSDSTQSALGDESSVTAVQRTSGQESQQSQSACVAPRVTAIQKRGFSEEVAGRIEAPQRVSTRAVYKSKWAIFVKWCKTHTVDFRSPSVTQIADFLLYLFSEKNLQPGTIDGYRTAIADMLGNDSLNISKDENLSRLLDSFHRDRPKGRRGIPSWNLSLMFHQLTKAPFEPLRKASLKHLTFKTVFLLALGSGKRRSEIHAWLYKNIRHQENWSQVSLYPSPSFLSKNQLARDGPASVAPVVIPALAPTLDNSLSEDKSLCPVRALRYYLDRTKDFRSGKDLLFVSFKRGFHNDIVPATISLWIKQTGLLCYQLSDQETQDLHQIRAHDIRAFAASQAFQGGVSLEQILSACHWKAHNTFTQFYLKDLAWADSDLYHLGPVVAAQQIQENK